ncbi:MAG: hypothetical protein H0X29_10480 [Parachlamydiaceae bacterium]|nr:hypothetical protein [Parachlamydiaceae bacterium]
MEELELKLQVIHSRIDKVEFRQDNFEKELKHHEIAFAKTEVYVKEIYKQMEKIAEAVDSLKNSTTRSREDFKDDVYDARIAAKDAINVAADAAKQAVSVATNAAKDAINTGENRWAKFFEKIVWLIVGGIVAFAASKIHF